ncbi:MAG: hypothetical protein ACHQUC_02370 [Chlamydiales bacterium]
MHGHAQRDHLRITLKVWVMIVSGCLNQNVRGGVETQSDSFLLENRSLNTFVPAFYVPLRTSHLAITTQRYEPINLNQLKKSLQDKKLIQAIEEAENLFSDHSWLHKVKRVIKAGGHFVVQTLPSFIVRNRLITSISSNVGHFFNIIGLLFIPLDRGSNRIALLYRSNKLKEEKKTLKHQVRNYIASLVQQATNPHLDPSHSEQLVNEKKIIETRFTQLRLEGRSIKLDYIKYVCETIKNILSHASLLLSFSPFKSLIEIAGIIQNLPGLTEFFDFGISAFTLSRLIENERIYSDWQSTFKDCYLQPVQHGKLIETSRSLLEKRKAIMEKNMHALSASSDGHEKVEKFLENWKKGKSEAELQSLELEVKTPQDEIKFYLNHQEMIEISTRKALTRMIEKKLEFEGTFIQLQHTQSHFFYWYSTFALSFALSLGLVGFLAGPVAGASAIFLGLTMSSILLNFSFWIASSFINFLRKPNNSNWLNLKIFWHDAKYQVSNYWLKVQETELLKINPKFLDVIKSKVLQPVEKIPESVIKEYLAKEKRCSDLLDHVENLKEERRQNEWVDYAHFAKLVKKSPVVDNRLLDPIQGLLQALSKLDYSLISSEMKNFLIVEMGIDLEQLQKELSNAEEGKTERALQILKKDLMTFFTMNESAYIDFMKHQNASKTVIP